MSSDRIAIDDNILIEGRVSTAGSKILYNFIPPYNAAVVDKLSAAPEREIVSVKPSEFGISLTAGFGCVDAVAAGTASIGIGCDMNGSIRKEASRNGVYFIKPTYGTVSRFGLVSTSPSMEQIGVVCRDIGEGFETLSIIAGRDERDGVMPEMEKRDFSVPEDSLSGLKIGLPAICANELEGSANELESLGAETGVFDFPLLNCAGGVAYIISAAETSNSISRFDGIKFGYRPEEYTNFDDIYNKSRTECFTFETKLFTLMGMLVLTKEKYSLYFDKSLKIRRLIKAAADEVFEKYDAVLLPAPYSDDYSNAYDNLKYLALPNLTGSPAVSVPGGVQFMGKQYGEETLFRIARRWRCGL